MNLSLRYKVLILVSAMLIAALGTYLFVATRLFTHDKVAYVFDVESSLVDGLSEQTRAWFDLVVDKCRFFARESPRLSAAGRDQLANQLFGDDALYRLRVYDASAGKPRLLYNHLNWEGLKSSGLSTDDLNIIDQERPIPLEAVRAGEEGVLVQNSSLPPDLAMLTIAVRAEHGGERHIVVVDLGHEDLLRLYQKSSIHETYLVDKRGEILAHPDALRVVESRDATGNPLVQQAISGEVRRGVRQFRQGDHGERFLGAHGDVGLGDMHVITQVRRKEALQATRDLVRRSMLFGIAILLATLIVSVFFARALTAPLQRLQQAAERVGRSDFEVDVDTERSDEIGDLGRAFTNMASTIQETQAQLVSATRLATIGEIGAGITHEVRNPIAGIISLAQLAGERAEDEEKVRELLQHIEKAARRSSDTLNNLLKFARSSAGEMESLSVNALVQDSANIVRHQLQIHGVKLDLQLAESDVSVQGSPSELQQVLVNLAINAQQAMPEGGHVRFESTGENGWAQILVSDDGPGIPEGVAERIFEPFFTTKPPGEGTGLGLSVSQAIIRAHGGALDIESTGSKGTTFRIRLPVE